MGESYDCTVGFGSFEPLDSTVWFVKIMIFFHHSMEPQVLDRREYLMFDLPVIYSEIWNLKIKFFGNSLCENDVRAPFYPCI
ncbi:unnamed protein product [Trifolium pratense]|uniref:Uncharacterized protein n=1 Tax=Trifolium pratense TaxID=57577 RepID=A0ACB0K346_TRIPR|nr:unnamed protein product [Trifolium pratense]